MRNLVLSAALLLPMQAAVAPLHAAAVTVALPGDSLLSERFSVLDSTAVPGATLKSGSYVIRVVDHMSDRSILRIETDNGKVLSTFLAVPHHSTDGAQGPVTYAGGPAHERALRGFNFPGNYSVEFVYPKAEAVKIATAHATSVQAIDPPSDNLPSKESKLTSDDMRMVTLWTLSPTEVNGTKGIAAAKYQPQETNAAPAPVVARNEPPAPPVAPPPPAPLPRQRPARVAPPTPPPPPPSSFAAAKPPARKPVATALPHTASELPAVLLAGLLSLCAAGTLRVRRMLLTR